MHRDLLCINNTGIGTRRGVGLELGVTPGILPSALSFPVMDMANEIVLGWEPNEVFEARVGLSVVV